MTGLDPRLRAVARNLPRVARAQGFNARVTSAYRSRAAQAKLYDRYLRGLQPYPVAPPGTSDHEKGIALDVVSTNLNKLVPLLAQVGLNWYGPSDPVHFTLAPVSAQATKKNKSLAKKVLGVTSWVPGPVGLVSSVIDFLF